jgi:hypothetical protein
MKTYVAIDNGVSGGIAILTGDNTEYYDTPVKKVLKYTKSKKQYITRLDFREMKTILSSCDKEHTLVIIERPFVNPKMFNSSMSSIRCHEATLICLELLELPYEYIDSKKWQKIMLPAGCKKKQDLKKASLNVGLRLFPGYKKEIIKHKDADSFLIAEWARRCSL